jgi:hypothetical protein
MVDVGTFLENIGLILAAFLNSLISWVPDFFGALFGV